MITNADRLMAQRANKSLEDYFLDKLYQWESTLDALSQAKKYKIANGQGSSRENERVEIADAEAQVRKWTEKLENLLGESTTSPKVRTLFTAGFANA